MQKKIAIAVDGSVHSNQAVAYAAKLAEVVSELHVVLMHIQPGISTYLLEEAQTSMAAATQLRAMVGKNQAAGRELVDKYREQLKTAGIADDRIATKSRTRNIGVADDLLAWCQAESYDALLVGRRGISYLQGLVMGSVTANLVNHSELTPIWLVDGQAASADKILLAVDGSPRALRAVDHLAFMLSGNPDSRVHMLHIQPRLQDYCAIDLSGDNSKEAEAVILDSDQRCLDDFHGQALAVFTRHGFKEDHLHLETVSGQRNVGKAILAYARDNGFGTVVIGKHGTSKSLFFGSVAQYVVQKLEDRAVWIVP